MAKGAANARRYFLNQQFSCLGTHRGELLLLWCVYAKNPLPGAREGDLRLTGNRAAQSGGRGPVKVESYWGRRIRGRRTTAGLPPMFIARNNGSFHGVLAGGPFSGGAGMANKREVPLLMPGAKPQRHFYQDQ